VYGLLVRANAVFAVPPLLIYMARPSLVSRPILFALTCVIISIGAIPVSNFINHEVLGAEASHPLRQLQVFDVAGTAYYSGDPSVFSDDRISWRDITECYSPVIRDTLDAGDKCHISLDAKRQDPTRTWLLAIIRHPVAYAKHRAMHLNSELSTYLLRHHPEDSMYNWMVYVDVKPTTFKEWLIDCVRKSIIFRPWFSLVLGVVVLLLSFANASVRSSELSRAAFCLTASGLSYMCAYLFVGVSTDYRYQYWGIIAIMCASVIYLASRSGASEPFSRARGVPVFVVVLVLVVIQIAMVV
jgi:hypothetical protein